MLCFTDYRRVCRGNTPSISEAHPYATLLVVTRAHEIGTLNYMYIAIDIGGTKTLLATFDQAGQLLETHKFPTPTSYEAFIKDLADNVALLSTSNFTAGAIGMPGTIDRSTGVSVWSGGNLTWKNNSIADDISKITNCKILLENDANLAGLSEARLLKNMHRQALYITISTGIGGVYIIDGNIDTNTINAEIGHMIFKEDGAYKSWETLSSGKAFLTKYEKRASEVDDPQIWTEFTEDIAIGIINVCASLTPDVIIIGGGAGANLPKFQAPLEKWIQDIAPNAIKVPPIRVAQRPEEAVIYGCYELAKDFANV